MRNTPSRRLMYCDGVGNLVVLEFHQTYRVLLMPVVSAAAAIVPSIFMFKGSLIVHGEVLRNENGTVNT